MKTILTIVIFGCLVSLPAFSQDIPSALAQQLTTSAKTEKEKVTAIFHWITDNITYRVKPGNQNGKAGKLSPQVEEEDTAALKPLNERVAENVLRSRVAACDGYARLFKTLCDYAGLRAEVIAGYGKSNRDHPNARFGVNHYWNAVFFDDQWHLLDATWASGYVNLGGDQFVKEYDARYFLTSPELFLRDHYPDDPRWTLLPDTQAPEEFRNSPFKQKNFLKYGITSFFPKKGIIEAAVGDTIVLRLEGGGPRDENICPDLAVDSSLFTSSPAWVFLRPDGGGSPTVRDNRFQYTYPVSSEGVRWLYLIYNEDLVLRYRLVVRR